MYQLVKKCDCCEARFSNICICVINARHKKALSIALKKHLDELKLKGETSLIVRDKLIVAIQYEYANQSEIDRADQIVEEIDIRCSEFLDDEVIDKCDVEFIPLAA